MARWSETGSTVRARRRLRHRRRIATDPIAELGLGLGLLRIRSLRTAGWQILWAVAQQEGRDGDQADHDRKDASDKDVAQHAGAPGSERHHLDARALTARSDVCGGLAGVLLLDRGASRSRRLRG